MKKNHHEAVEYRLRRERQLQRRRFRDRDPPDETLVEYEILKCPSRLDITDKGSRRAFLEMLEALHHFVSHGRERFLVDFSALTRVTSGAGILLRAEIERVRKIYPQVIMRGKPPNNLKCAHVLTQIGVAKLCGMKQRHGLYDDVLHWRAVTGNDVDGETYATELMGPYEDRLPGGIDRNLYVGVSEAMTNVSHHAYIDTRQDGLRDIHEEERQWWMFSQERKNVLHVVICDLGIGIPRTLPISKKPELAGVRRWMRSNDRNDADILSAVLKKTAKDRPSATGPDQTISRTGEPHRGRGLYNIVHAVRGVEDASVGVLSNHGAWIKNTGVSGGVKQSYKDSIKGTIIFWSIPIEQ